MEEWSLAGTRIASPRDRYDEKYIASHGRYRLERIRQIGLRFSTYGDYLQGALGSICTNPVRGRGQCVQCSRDGALDVEDDARNQDRFRGERSRPDELPVYNPFDVLKAICYGRASRQTCLLTQ